MAAENSLPVAETAEALLNGSGPTTDELEMPEWGCTVVLRSLTRAEARQFAEMEPEDAEVHAVHLCVVSPPLTVEQAGQLLTEKSLGATNRLLDRIMEVSGLAPGFPAGEED